MALLDSHLMNGFSYRFTILAICLAVGVLSPFHVALAHTGELVANVEQVEGLHTLSHEHGHHHGHHHHPHVPASNDEQPAPDSGESPDHSHSVYDHAGLILGKSSQLQDVLVWGPVVVFDDAHLGSLDTSLARSDQSPPDSSPPLPANPRGPPAAS